MYNKQILTVLPKLPHRYLSCATRNNIEKQFYYCINPCSNCHVGLINLCHAWTSFPIWRPISMPAQTKRQLNRRDQESTYPSQKKIRLGSHQIWSLSHKDPSKPLLARAPRLDEWRHQVSQLDHSCSLTLTYASRRSVRSTVISVLRRGWLTLDCSARIRLILLRRSFLEVQVSSCSRDDVPWGTPRPAHFLMPQPLAFLWLVKEVMSSTSRQ